MPKSLLLLPFGWLLFGLASARGDDLPPRSEENSPATKEPAATNAKLLNLSEEELAELDIDPSLLSEDIIIVYANRPERSFDRDTVLRLSGKDLRRRGANSVADALDLLPELVVRAAGRGGRQIDIRGARKGSVKILLDGIAVSDPYYGNIDLSAIPVTDIEEVRVSATPISPIDGIGGAGGVIEIFTLDAIGDSQARARLTSATLPSADVSATGRTRLGENLAARMSITASLGAQDFDIEVPNQPITSLSEDREQSVGAFRLEYRKKQRRLLLDLWTQKSAFVAPPAADGSGNFLRVKGETQGRAGLSYDDSLAGFRTQARVYAHLLSRQSAFYEDPALTEMATDEDLFANRLGAALVANRPLGEHYFLLFAGNLDRERADTEGFDGQRVRGAASIVQGASALQFRSKKVQADASAGLAVPVGIGAAPFPEWKLGAMWKAAPQISLGARTGYKGRTPTLRERYRVDIGNESLGPEKALYGELEVEIRPTETITFNSKGYYRQTNGMVRFDASQSQLVNIDDLQIYGADSVAHTQLGRTLRLGTNYSIAVAKSEQRQFPLDFFAKHRVTPWIRYDREGWGGLMRLQYLGPQIDRNTRLDRRAILQANAYYRYSDYLFSLRGENLANQDYEQRVGVQGQGLTVFASIQGEWR